jgi:hypothetical protein
MICCTLARLSPRTSAISGPFRSPPKRSARISRSRSESLDSASLRSGPAVMLSSGPATGGSRCSSSSSVRRLRSRRWWSIRRLRAIARSQVRSEARRGVEAAPGAQGALEGGLRQILGDLTVAEPVGEKPVYGPHVLAVHAREVRLGANSCGRHPKPGTGCRSRLSRCSDARYDRELVCANGLASLRKSLSSGPRPAAAVARDHGGSLGQFRAREDRRRSVGGHPVSPVGAHQGRDGLHRIRKP